jgi:hypothetical protein
MASPDAGGVYTPDAAVTAGKEEREEEEEEGEEGEEGEKAKEG